jgi:hypothetical protein
MPRISRLFRDQSGTIAIMTALTLPLLIGFAALGVEVTEWYAEARSIEAAADNAALSAAVAYAQGNKEGYTQEATAVAGTNGFVNGANGVMVNVYKPPTSGSHQGNNSAIQVNISAPITPLLAAMFISGFNVNGNGVAIITPPNTGGNGCVLALDSAGVTGSTRTGNTNINLVNCSFDVNATSATASLVMTGSATLNAGQVNLGGGYNLSGSATLTATNGVNMFQPPIKDPYAGRQIPSFSGCNQTKLAIHHTPAAPLQPGVYCGGIDITGGTVTLSPGIYILNQGDLTLNGNASIVGTGGVTIILTTSSTDFSTVGNVVINGGSTVDLVAPTTGPTAGIAIWQDGRAPDSGSDKINGGSTFSITGAIYLPSESVTYTGGSATTASGCTQLVAFKITFTGDSSLGNNCTGTGVSQITPSSNSSVTQLVE